MLIIITVGQIHSPIWKRFWELAESHPKKQVFAAPFGKGRMSKGRPS